MKRDPLATDPIVWKALTTQAREHLTHVDLDWLMEGAGLFTGQQRIDQSIRTAFGNPDWWPAWRDWRNEWKKRSASVAAKASTNGHTPAFEPPYPPDEPEGLWEEAEHLLITGSYLESISAALIRLLLAQGREARKLLERPRKNRA